MSHYHLEIVMPPTADVHAAVTQILAPFDESLDREDEAANGHPFWDWWVIGGRWAGEKITCAFGKKRMGAFYSALHAEGVTVSSVRCGKESLSPKSQIAKVDAMWREHFPESQIMECPLFDHYKGDIGDVMKLSDVPENLTAHRVIVAGPSFDESKLRASYMVETEIWNGVCHTRSTWSGKLYDALAEHAKDLERAISEYAAKQTPKPDWLVVTIDYHS